jgi:citrate synthase
MPHKILHQLHGSAPDPVAVETLDMSLILYAEHEYNASTFTARTTVSTLSDMHSGVVSAIGTLKGPLHGGANEKAMDIFEELKDPAHAGSWLQDKLDRRERVMGFGHRVYKNGDHRAVVMREKAKDLGRADGRRDWAGIYDVLVDTVLEQKGLHPNVDFPCGLAYLVLGFPRDICTPLFVASRLSGWCAHITEQLDNNRLIRPLSEYTGPEPREYIAMDDR